MTDEIKAVTRYITPSGKVCATRPQAEMALLQEKLRKVLTPKRINLYDPSYVELDRAAKSIAEWMSRDEPEKAKAILNVLSEVEK